MRSVLDRSDREDVRLHQPCCANASAFGLRGYVENTLPSRCYVITKILHVRSNFFEITTFPNSITYQPRSQPANGCIETTTAHVTGVGERSNFKKIPTYTQDHGDGIATRLESVSTYPRRLKAEALAQHG